jgi:hypothetical protein
MVRSREWRNERRGVVASFSCDVGGVNQGLHYNCEDDVHGQRAHGILTESVVKPSFRRRVLLSANFCQHIWAQFFM